MQYDRPLSKHFTLYELLHSDLAERNPDLWDAQVSPPPRVVKALEYLAVRALEPIRSALGVPILVSGGYRSAELNRLVGGAARSQHLQGEAADLHLSDRFDLGSPVAFWIAEQIVRHTGRQPRIEIGPDYWLFAWVCLNLADLDVDQVIHEYGPEPGRPAWVHVAASSPSDRAKREILRIYRDRAGSRTVRLTLEQALRLGT